MTLLMGIHNTSVTIEINAPASAVWVRVHDHENTHTWVTAVKKVTLVHEGMPRNGIPGIRRVQFRPLMWSTIEEAIVRYEEGHTFEYKIVKGMPGLNDHLGKVVVEMLDPQRSRLTWSVMFDFKPISLGLFGDSFVKGFTVVLQAGIENLKKQLEASHRSA